MERQLIFQIQNSMEHECFCRKKMDANRDKEEGAQNDPIAMEAWDTFHNYIQVSQQEMGRGILFDVHKYA